MRLVDLICRPDARHRLIIGLAAGAAIFFALHGHLGFTNAVIPGIAGWNAFALVIVALDWVTILTTPQRKIRELAQQQDLSRFLIFVFVIVAACAALFAVGFLVSRPKEQTAGVHVALTLLTVASSWTLVHTVFSFRYAHAFYGDSDVSGVHHHAEGLTFPPDRPHRPPDYLDFAYFSFGIGMTCQVSDVQINSRRMRRLALVHSVLSFGFNTIILALLINTISGLLQSPDLGKADATGAGVFPSPTRLSVLTGEPFAFRLSWR